MNPDELSEFNKTYLLANEILLNRREMKTFLKSHGFFRKKKIEKYVLRKAKEMKLELSETSIDRVVAMVAVRSLEIDLA